MFFVQRLYLLDSGAFCVHSDHAAVFVTVEVHLEDFFIVDLVGNQGLQVKLVQRHAVNR